MCVCVLLCECAHRTVTFEVRSKSVTLAKFTSDADVITQAAVELLRKELPVSLRLMGVRMTHFEVCTPIVCACVCVCELRVSVCARMFVCAE